MQHNYWALKVLVLPSPCWVLRKVFRMGCVGRGALVWQMSGNNKKEIHSVSVEMNHHYQHWHLKTKICFCSCTHSQCLKNICIHVGSGICSSVWTLGNDNIKLSSFTFLNIWKLHLRRQVMQKMYWHVAGYWFIPFLFNVLPWGAFSVLVVTCILRANFLYS